MFIPVPTANQIPGKTKSKSKFLGFFASAEAAARVHDQVAYHVTGKR